MNNLKGYGFRPSEEELIGYLRKRTLLGRDYLVQAITDLELDICNWEPWDLPGHSRASSKDLAWYFIYPITHKHPNSQRKMIHKPTGKRMPINRATKDGKWKVSGDRIKVKASNSEEETGIKTRLYFYTSDVNEEKDSHKNKATKQQKYYQKKTPWVLYEYELINVDPSQNKYFLGKLMKQNQFSTSEHGNPSQNSVVVDINKTYPEERSNEHNIVANNESFNLLASFEYDDAENFYRRGLSDYDFVNVDELLRMMESHDKCNVIQNQSSTNEQDAEIKNSRP